MWPLNKFGQPLRKQSVGKPSQTTERKEMLTSYTQVGQSTKEEVYGPISLDNEGERVVLANVYQLTESRLYTHMSIF